MSSVQRTAAMLRFSSLAGGLASLLALTSARSTRESQCTQDVAGEATSVAWFDMRAVSSYRRNA